MDSYLVVFLVIIFTGTGDGRREINSNLYFHDLNDCNYFAKRLSARYTNYRWLDIADKDRVVTYCVPRTINPEQSKVKVH